MLPVGAVLAGRNDVLNRADLMGPYPDNQFYGSGPYNYPYASRFKRGLLDQATSKVLGTIDTFDASKTA